tara:strand:- start:1191 stop:1325 length:135 start_codon:yes stop_codon:yes gene_type:complete
LTAAKKDVLDCVVAMEQCVLIDVNQWDATAVVHRNILVYNNIIY